MKIWFRILTPLKSEMHDTNTGSRCFFNSNIFSIISCRNPIIERIICIFAAKFLFNMKKTIYALAILTFGFINAQQKVDVKVSYGSPSLYGMAESITGDALNAFNVLIPGREFVQYSSNGVFAVDVMLHSGNDKWRYGLGYNNETVTDNRNNFKGNFNTFLAQADYSWLNPDNKFKLYSGLGAGVVMTNLTQNSTKENDVIFAFNVTPIGISYGQTFAVFLETNVGTKGLAQGGVSYTF